MQQWITEHLGDPAIPVGKVASLAQMLRDRGIEPTADEMLRYGELSPAWRLTSEPTGRAA